MAEGAARREVEKARRARERATAQYASATQQLVDACVAARAAGVPMTEIAQLAGLNRAGLYKLLGRGPRAGQRPRR